MGEESDALADAVAGRRWTPTRLASRPVALDVVALTDRMTRVATLRSTPARTLRNTVIPLVGRVPAVRRRTAMTFSELQYR